jgi:hypothetical protein
MCSVWTPQSWKGLTGRSPPGRDCAPDYGGPPGHERDGPCSSRTVRRADLRAFQTDRHRSLSARRLSATDSAETEMFNNRTARHRRRCRLDRSGTWCRGSTGGIDSMLPGRFTIGCGGADNQSGGCVDDRNGRRHHPPGLVSPRSSSYGEEPWVAVPGIADAGVSDPWDGQAQSSRHDLPSV